MITIYSGKERYISHLKGVLLIDKPLSPHELVNFAKEVIKKQQECDLYNITYSCNSPDFVSTIAHACEALGIECKLILNGKESNLEGVFKFFNKAYDLQREFLNNIKNERCTHPQKPNHMKLDGNCELWKA